MSLNRFKVLSHTCLIVYFVLYRQILTNADQNIYQRNINTWHMTVIQTPTVPTPRARFTAPVIRDIQEMESHVLVSCCC